MTEISDHDWMLLSAYLDDELDLGKRATFTQRLEQESSLADAYADLGGLKEDLRALRPMSGFASPGVTAVRRWGGWAATLAAALTAVALLGFEYFDRPLTAHALHQRFLAVEATKFIETYQPAAVQRAEGDKAIDRSPCGTGTSARMAHWAARRQLSVGDSFIHESIIGSLFEGRVEAATKVGDRDAIIPSIAGWARQTVFNTIFIDDRDPYAHGFVVT